MLSNKQYGSRFWFGRLTVTLLVNRSRKKANSKTNHVASSEQIWFYSMIRRMKEESIWETIGQKKSGIRLKICWIILSIRCFIDLCIGSLIKVAVKTYYFGRFLYFKVCMSIGTLLQCVNLLERTIGFKLYWKWCQKRNYTIHEKVWNKLVITTTINCWFISCLSTVQLQNWCQDYKIEIYWII